MDKKYLSRKNIILLIAVLTILISYQITAYSYEVEVRRAFLDEQDNIIANSNYCSIDSSLMSRLGLEVGNKVKIGVGNKSALYTIVQARDEDGDIVRMGLSGRKRVGEEEPFSAYLTKVEEVKVEKALFSLGLHDIVDNSNYSAIDSNLMESLGLEIGQEIIVRAKDEEDELARYTIVEALDEGENIIRIGLSGRRRLNQSDPFAAYISSSQQDPHIERAYNPELTQLLAEKIEDREDVLSLGAVIVSSEGVEQIGATGLRAAGEQEKIHHGDPWHLGSLTKAMTATLAGVYVDQGLISFDSTIEEVLGSSINNIHSGYRDATLRQLLAHRSGVASNVPSMSTDSNKTVSENRHVWVEETLQREPEYTPGTERNYSNAGFIVAGKMLEEVAGDSWENLMKEEVFAPLEMEDSGFGVPGSRDEIDTPRGHNYSDGEFRVRFSDNPAPLGPAGTVYTSLRDYGNFLVDQTAGVKGEGKLLKQETYLEIFASDLGWFGSHRNFNHAGSNTMWYALTRGSSDSVSVMVVTNSGNSAASSLVNDVSSLLKREYGD